MSLELTQISRMSLPEMIIEKIRQQIVSGQLKPGDRLPPERELCEGFGVGRSTIREALTAGAMMGFLERRQDGTYVLPSSHWRDREMSYELCMAKVSIEEVFETRDAIELDIAALAAQRASREDIEAAESFIVMDVDKIQVYNPLDEGFHMALAEATQNRVLIQVFREASYFFFKSSKFRERLQKPDNSELLAVVIRQAMQGHVRILDAVKAHDPDRAVQEMKHHLQTVKEGLWRLK